MLFHFIFLNKTFEDSMLDFIKEFDACPFALANFFVWCRSTQYISVTIPFFFFHASLDTA